MRNASVLRKGHQRQKRAGNNSKTTKAVKVNTTTTTIFEKGSHLHVATIRVDDAASVMQISIPNAWLPRSSRTAGKS
jgi:hypothetical protein